MQRLKRASIKLLGKVKQEDFTLETLTTQKLWTAQSNGVHFPPECVTNNVRIVGFWIYSRYIVVVAQVLLTPLTFLMSLLWRP